MAFTQGVAQLVHITTLDGADPVAPSHPAVTVSLDGGATFEATDNAAVTTAYGVSLELSAAETARDLVLVRVTADNADAQVVAYYFEDAYTPQRAENLDAAVSSRAEPGDEMDLVDAPNATAIAAIQSGIGGGSGAHAITLYVKDEDGNPIAGAAVSIPTAGTQTSAASTGAVNFNLDAGTYTATIRSSAAYTPDASYTVTVNASGAVTAPADAVLEVAAASLPAPSSPDNYLLWCDETQVDYGDVAFGEGEMTVEIVRMSQAARKNVDDNKYRSFVQRKFSTDANGQWSIEIPKDVVEAGGTLTLRRQYTDENGYPVTEDTTVILDADMAEDDDTLAWTSLQSTDNE